VPVNTRQSRQLSQIEDRFSEASEGAKIEWNIIRNQQVIGSSHTMFGPRLRVMPGIDLTIP
jgi:hypothetical protein